MLGVRDDIGNCYFEGDKGDEWGNKYASDADCHSESGSESFTSDDNADIGKYYDYGDLNETGGSYKVQLADGTEVSLEEHENSCGCGCGEGFSQGDITSESGGELSDMETSELEMSDEELL